MSVDRGIKIARHETAPRVQHGRLFAIGTVLANVIAWPIAFFAMRKWLSGFDDRVALSSLYFLTAGLIAIAIAAATVFGQAWRVARAEPARALRYE